MNELITLLKQIEEKEIKSLEEDECIRPFVNGVEFGMNYLLIILKEINDIGIERYRKEWM